jgi:hypothetical protein
MSEMIRMTFSSDDDGTGELTVTAGAQGFAGVGSAWFNADDLEAFASRLAEYPLSHPMPAIAGGWGNEPGVLSQEHVGISTYPVGSKGQIGVQVRLATPELETDSALSRRAVQLEVLTTYERLGRFARQLGAMIRGEVPEAVLEAEHLA